MISQVEKDNANLRPYIFIITRYGGEELHKIWDRCVVNKSYFMTLYYIPIYVMEIKMENKKYIAGFIYYRPAFYLTLPDFMSRTFQDKMCGNMNKDNERE